MSTVIRSRKPAEEVMNVGKPRPAVSFWGKGPCMAGGTFALARESQRHAACHAVCAPAESWTQRWTSTVWWTRPGWSGIKSL